MAITRKITASTASKFLIGFGCAGGLISDPQGDIPYKFTTTDAASSSDIAGTSDPLSIITIQGGPTYPASGDTSPKEIKSANNYEVLKDANTKLSYTYEDNSIGQAACQIALRIIGYSTGDTYEKRHDVYSCKYPTKAPDGLYKNRMTWPAPVSPENFNYSNFYFGFDCSSFVSFVYRIVFGNTTIGNKYARYNYDTGKWVETLYTEKLADLAVDKRLIVNLNCFDSDTLLPGDILLYASNPDHKYNVGHAAMYLGYYEYHPITNQKVNAHLIIETSAVPRPLRVCGIEKLESETSDSYSRVHYRGIDIHDILMVFRPSIQYFREVQGMDCYGLNVTSDQISKTMAGYDDFADSNRHSVLFKNN